MFVSVSAWIVSFMLDAARLEADSKSSQHALKVSAVCLLLRSRAQPLKSVCHHTSFDIDAFQKRETAEDALKKYAVVVFFMLAITLIAAGRVTQAGSQ